MRNESGIGRLAGGLGLLASLLGASPAAAAGSALAPAVGPATSVESGLPAQRDLAGNPAFADWGRFASSMGALSDSALPARSQGPASAAAVGVLSWGAISPSPGMIPGRLGAAVLHDPAPEGGRLLVIGGYDGAYWGDVWELASDGSPSWDRWTMPGQSFPARTTPVAVRDSRRGRVIVFGGFDGTQYLNDAWSLSLGATRFWTRLQPSGTSPPARTAACAVYDSVGDRVVVFGGTRFGAYLNDVWALSLSGVPAWQQLSPSGAAPSGRQYAAVAWDAARSRMLVFGGYDGATLLGDAWALDLSGSPAWSLVSAGGGGPSPRTASGAVYDSPRDRLLVFGGSSAQGSLNDLWALSLASVSWTKLAPDGQRPAGRWGPGFVYDRRADRWLVFGGYGGGYLSDTWKLFYPTPPPPPPLLTEPTADSFWITGEPGSQRVSWQGVASSIHHLSVQYSPTGVPPWIDLETGVAPAATNWTSQQELPAADATGARVRLVAFDLDGAQLADAVGPGFALGHHASIRLDIVRDEPGGKRYVVTPPVLSWSHVPNAVTYEVTVKTDLFSSCEQRSWSSLVPAARTWLSFDAETWHGWPASRNKMTVRALDAGFQPVGDPQGAWFDRHILTDLDPTYFNDFRPPVVLVHGWVESHDQTWARCEERPLVDALSSGNGTGTAFHPWAFDYPNIGSVRASAAGLSKAVDYVRSQTFGTSVRLVGHSMGGLVSRAYLEGFAEDPNTGQRLAPPIVGTISHLATLATPHVGEPWWAVLTASVVGHHLIDRCLGDPFSAAARGLMDWSGVMRDLNQNGTMPALHYFFAAGTDPQGEFLGWPREIVLEAYGNCRGANDAAVSICSARGDCEGSHPYPLGAFDADATITRRQYALSHNRMSKPGESLAECATDESAAKPYDASHQSESSSLLRDLLEFLRCGPCLGSTDCPGNLRSKILYVVRPRLFLLPEPATSIGTSAQVPPPPGVPGAIVTIRAIDAASGATTFAGATNSTGEVTLDLEPGRYVVTFEGRGYVPRAETLRVAPRSVQVTNRVDLLSVAGYVGPKHPRVAVAGSGIAVADSAVVLQLACDDATQVMVGDAPDFRGSDWRPLAPGMPYVLQGGPGYRTVWVKYRDDAGRESDVVSVVVHLVPGAAGQLQVDAGGVAARILIDDTPTDLVTPAVVSPIGPGYHRVAVSAPGMRAEPPVLVVLVDSSGSANAQFSMVPSQPPSAPRWSTPLSGSLLGPMGRLEWTSGSDPDSSAVFYDLGFALDSLGASGALSVSGTADTGLHVPDILADSTEYFAAVRAIDGNETPQLEPPAVLRFRVDRTPPTGRIEFPAAGSEVPGNAPPALRFRVVDWGGLLSVTVRLSRDGGLSYPDTLYQGVYADSIPWTTVASRSTTCRIQLQVRDHAGNLSTIESDSLFTITGGTTGVEAPGSGRPFSLSVHPVPARTPVRIRFDLPTAGPVRLEVFDAAGRQMCRLASGRFPAGEHELQWSLRDDRGRPLTTGVYFVRLRAGGEVRLSRAVIVR